MSMTSDEVTELIHNLNSLTYGSWNETESSQSYGQSVSLALSFINPQTGLPDYYDALAEVTQQSLAAQFGSSFDTGTALSAAVQQQAIAAFNAWAKFANISLRSDVPADNLNTIQVALINITGAARDTEAVTLIRQIESNNPNLPIWGDMWLNSGSNYIQLGDFSVGTFNYETLLHEMGHALGLKHPVPQDTGGGDEPPFFQSGQWSSTRYTVMSYDRYKHRPATAPMLLDIAAIQRLYGANATTNANSGDIYRFTATGWPIQAIWDAGGAHDTIDGTGLDHDLVIDLNPGGRSYGESKGRSGHLVSSRVLIAFATDASGFFLGLRSGLPPILCLGCAR